MTKFMRNLREKNILYGIYCDWYSHLFSFLVWVPILLGHNSFGIMRECVNCRRGENQLWISALSCIKEKKKPNALCSCW